MARKRPSPKTTLIRLNRRCLIMTDQFLTNTFKLVRSRYVERKVKIADTVLVHATALLSAIKKEYDIE